MENKVQDINLFVGESLVTLNVKGIKFKIKFSGFCLFLSKFISRLISDRVIIRTCMKLGFIQWLNSRSVPLERFEYHRVIEVQFSQYNAPILLLFFLRNERRT